MAAQDLIIARRGTSAPSGYLDGDATEAGNPDGATILLAVLRKRWLLLFCIALVSAGLGVLAAMQLGQTTAIVNSSLIFTGLPDASRQTLFDPLGPATGAEMVESVRVLDKLVSKRGLGISPVSMGKAIDANIGRSSAMLNLTLTWNDAEDGIAILNDLDGIFIEEMSDQRKSIQRDHLQHLEFQLLQAKARVDDSRQQLAALRKQQEQQLDKGGLTADKYRTTLSSITSAEVSIDVAKTEQVGVQQQIEMVSKQIADSVAKKQQIEKDLRRELLHEAGIAMKAAHDRTTPNSNSARAVEATLAEVAQFAKSDKQPEIGDRWVKALFAILNKHSSGISTDDLEKLKDTFGDISHQGEVDLNSSDAERRRLEEQRNAMELRLIPLRNQIAMLEQHRENYLKEATKLKEEITGISAMQLDQFQHQVDEAEKLQDTLVVQRDSLRQLAESRLREWSVSVPASMETTQLVSSHAKIFVLTFAICCLIFSSPLMVAEWHVQTGTPQVQFARSLRVPILAERILEDFSPEQRKANAQARLDADRMETLRMLTLRIQQSCHRPGSVVLFSSLDSRFSAAPLMAGVAECLADREERVLLVDAVSPDRTLLPVLHLLPGGNGAAPANGKARSANALALTVPEPHHNAVTGLSEYLTEECEDIGELIRPTGCPGVDIIASGKVGFPREAMASSCLTELLNTCRRNYTMVLVHGPAVDSAADLQMLTARADGIVLAATKSVGKDPRARAIVTDLLELGAPVIGLVA